jgi:release factor glutamine methyltransferase
VESGRHDAEALAAHLLGVERRDLVLMAESVVDADAYAALVERRASREPLQHITGHAYFRHLDLLVGPGVFVPRPETEMLVEWCLKALADVASPVVVDLCTGSGAIALSIASELPGSQVHAVELDEGALAWAERNAAGSEVVLHHGDAAVALPELDGTVDLVVSNPPYIPLTEWEYVAPEARDHDPEPALWAGEDGLAMIRNVERTARRLLRPGGYVAVEHSDRQGTAACDVFSSTGWWTMVADHQDLAGRDRFVTATKEAVR